MPNQTRGLQTKTSNSERAGDFDRSGTQATAVSGPGYGLDFVDDKLTQPVEENEPNGTGMPDQLKEGLENLSGFSLDDVRVHYHSEKPAELNALAYTQGQDIHLGPGQKRHLPHEGWHAVQQLQGRVRPTDDANGIPINDDSGLEFEADIMGARAFRSTYLPNFGGIGQVDGQVANQSSTQLQRSEHTPLRLGTSLPQYLPASQTTQPRQASAKTVQRVEEPIKIGALRLGDVLIRKAITDSPTHAVIALGQAVVSHSFGGHAGSVHVALYAGESMVYESSGGGLAREPLNRGSEWLVFRYKNEHVARLAVSWAKHFTSKAEEIPKYGSYSKKGASGSLLHSSNRGKGARSAESAGYDPDEFYCSNFVVRCYARTVGHDVRRKLPINVDQRHISPKKLESVLKNSRRWALEGRLSVR